MAALASRQRSAIKSGFLAYLGKEKKEYTLPEALSSEGILRGVGQSLIDLFKSNLRETDSIASGDLSQSIAFTITTDADTVVMRVTMAEYYKYVDQGVQGFYSTYPETEKSPFRYKSPYPGKKMARAFGRWITQKGIPLEYNRGLSGRARLKDAAKQRLSLAYAIASKVKQDGTRATNFYSSVINDQTAAALEETLRERIGKQITIALLP